MTRVHAVLLTVAAATLALAGCDRGPSREAGSTTAVTTGASTVQQSASTPSGLTNPSTAAQGGDLSNSTRATGNSNVYQPPSTDNPAPGAASASVDVASGAASATGQSTSSQTRGTSAPPDDGTLPGGTAGSTGSRRGGGKS